MTEDEYIKIQYDALAARCYAMRLIDLGKKINEYINLANQALSQGKKLLYMQSLESYVKDEANVPSKLLDSLGLERNKLIESLKVIFPPNN